jgi:hypothetical protein
MRCKDAFRRTIGGAVVAWIVLCYGCAVGNPVAKWKSAVDRYVADIGNGDPQVLRTVAGSNPSQVDRRGLITFNRLALRAGWPPGRTYDVFGALLEVHPMKEGQGYVFVVAVAERARPTGSDPIPAAEIRDLRLAVMHTPARTWRWKVSPVTPSSTEQYRAARIESDALARPFFPAPGDRFECETHDGRLIVTERRSGARWELSLSSEMAAASPG